MVARFRSPDALAFSKRYGTVRYGKIWFDFRIDGQVQVFSIFFLELDLFSFALKDVFWRC